MYVRCDESSLYFRINYVHVLTRNFSAGYPGIIKTMHTGFSAYTYCIMHQRPSADTESRIMI